MQAAIDAYFAECDPHVAEYKYLRSDKRGRQLLKTEKRITQQVPYTMAGLRKRCIWTGERSSTTRTRTSFFPPLKRPVVKSRATLSASCSAAAVSWPA
jgi:hypothetical protein